MVPGHGKLMALLLLLTGSFVSPASGQEVNTIMFGSCLVPSRPHPALEIAAEAKPDLFLFLGDNVYADTTDQQEMRRHYQRLGNSPAFQRLRESSRVAATWDDHDFGRNDSGAAFEAKEMAEAIFESFWGTQPRPRGQVPGIYGSLVYGTGAEALRIIILDTRYFRSALRRGASSAPGKGPYVPVQDPGATLLGAAQWGWLEEELNKPAALRIILSSIQVLAEHHGYESWANFPAEKQRLLRLIYDTGIPRTLILSGDRHFAEMSAAEISPDGQAVPADRASGPLLYDVTSSGINRRYPHELPTSNEFRVGNYYLDYNVGRVLVRPGGEDGSGGPLRAIEASILDSQGRVVLSWDLNS